MSIVRTSRRIWVVVSAAVVVVGAMVAIVRAIVKVDEVEDKVFVVESTAAATKKELKAEIELLRRYERRNTGRIHKIDAKADIIMERLGIPIPAHLRAPTDPEELEHE